MWNSQRQKLLLKLLPPGRSMPPTKMKLRRKRRPLAVARLLRAASTHSMRRLPYLPSRGSAVIAPLACSTSPLAQPRCFLTGAPRSGQRQPRQLHHRQWSPSSQHSRPCPCRSRRLCRWIRKVARKFPCPCLPCRRRGLCWRPCLLCRVPPAGRGLPRSPYRAACVGPRHWPERVSRRWAS